MRQDGGWLTILKSIIIKYKNTYNEVYIDFMCKGAQVWGEYRYKGANPILNVLGSGGSRISHLSARSYLRCYS